jgi:hypothetical protein
LATARHIDGLAPDGIPTEDEPDAEKSEREWERRNVFAPQRMVTDGKKS